MRVVLDTNILISALISKTAAPHQIYQAWRGKRIELLTCAEQLVEVREVTRRVAVALRIKPFEAGRLVNQLRSLATVVSSLPQVRRSPDPQDDFILALAQAGNAAYIVTGDKSGLLALHWHGEAQIVAARQWVAQWLQSPKGIV
jgi:putative PIN family toxin of toxin-antitoxin system